MNLDVGTITAGLDKIVKDLPAVGRAASKRTGQTVRAALAREMSRDTGIPVGKVKEQIIVLATTTGVQLSCAGARIPLIDFRARGPEPSRGQGHGVTYVNPGSGRSRDEHAFIATMPKGKRGVFRRSRFGRAGIRYSNRARISKLTGRVLTGKREVIEELFGPSLPHVFKKFRESVGIPVGRAAMLKNLQHEFVRRFGGGTEFPFTAPAGSDNGGTSPGGE